MQEETGWLYLLWRLCRPSDANPPGLGMAWQDAVRLNSTIAHFLLSSEASAKARSMRARYRYLEANGQMVDVAAQGEAYMAALRKQFDPEGTVGPKYKRPRKGEP